MNFGKFLCFPMTSTVASFTCLHYRHCLHSLHHHHKLYMEALQWEHMWTIHWQGQAQTPRTDLGCRWSELYCPQVDLTRQWMRPGTRDKPLAVYYCQFSIVLTNWGNTLICEDCFLITFTFSSIINTIFCSVMRRLWVPGAEVSPQPLYPTQVTVQSAVQSISDSSVYELS